MLLYLKLHPQLSSVTFLKCMLPTTTVIIRFRLGSHKLPIGENILAEYTDLTANMFSHRVDDGIVHPGGFYLGKNVY